LDLLRLVNALPAQGRMSAQPRPYLNHAVRSIPVYSAAERAEMLEHVGLNVFFYPAEMVTGCDLLSDSGTTAMTNTQWAALHHGDEAYGSNKGYFVLMERIRETFGEAFFNDPSMGVCNAFLFHQGRACEDALFGALAATGESLCIPSNGHFDTTRANVEANRIEALDIPCRHGDEAAPDEPFKGNMDAARLAAILSADAERIPCVFLTVTNNVGGGQPVSMENIRSVAALCMDHGIPLFFDACRFAENAWFIKRYERGYGNRKIPEIVHEMFSYADGFTISFKKDGLSNIGGGLFVRHEGQFHRNFPKLLDDLVNWQILKEGHPTYGGMSGRDIMALAEGLQTVTIEGYLDYRIQQVREFGEAMAAAGVPVVRPIGGHAVYVDINRFFEDTAMQPGDYGGVALASLLLAAYGHRACELGCFAFGEYNPETGEESYPPHNYLRFAVPRLLYEKQDLDSAAEAMGVLFDRRGEVPGVNVVYGRDLPLRHFKARFEFKPLKEQTAVSVTCGVAT
jgi:tyrosine phenol-lyase